MGPCPVWTCLCYQVHEMSLWQLFHYLLGERLGVGAHAYKGGLSVLRLCEVLSSLDVSMFSISDLPLLILYCFTERVVLSM